jgi:hypothetical protein
MKIIAIADRLGPPLAVTTHAANHHGVTLVQLTFKSGTFEIDSSAFRAKSYERSSERKIFGGTA